MFDLLPPNATQAERSLSLAIGRDVPVPVATVWNPDTCPADLLPWLAWAMSVDEWDTNWTEAQKRAVIKASIQVHMYKGTIGAVEEAAAAISTDVRVQEWFNQQPAGDEYTFKLLVDSEQVGLTEAGMTKLLRVVDTTKNLRSHLDGVTVNMTTRATLNVASAILVGHEITLHKFESRPLVLNEGALCLYGEMALSETSICI